MRRLTAAMIARDEEKMLPGCLESIEDAVEGVAIVDTGSIDNTVQVAMDHGATVQMHQWQSDFSYHRTQSFTYANSTYILLIDADERLHPESVEKMPYLLDFMDNNQLNFAALQIESDLEAGGMGLTVLPRIFRKGTVRFMGSIMEQPISEGKGYLSNLSIHHLRRDEEGTQKRNLQREDMLRMALEKDPNNSLYSQALVRNLRAQGEWEECAGLARRLLHSGELGINRRQEQMITLDLLIASMAMESDDALKIGTDMAKKFPENLDAHYYLGTLLMEAEDLDGAISALQNYVVIRNRIKTTGLHKPLMIETWGWDALAFNNLGVAYWKRGDLMDALYSMFIGRNLNGELGGLQENMRQIMGTLLFKKGEIERYFPEIGEAREEGV